jgi:hypothetical protein
MDSQYKAALKAPSAPNGWVMLIIAVTAFLTGYWLF